MPKTNWRAGARLLLNEQSGQPPREIDSGQLADMITLALSQAEADKPRLHLIYEASGRQLSWEAIKAMSERPNFPVFI